MGSIPLFGEEFPKKRRQAKLNLFISGRLNVFPGKGYHPLLKNGADVIPCTVAFLRSEKDKIRGDPVNIPPRYEREEFPKREKDVK